MDGKYVVTVKYGTRALPRRDEHETLADAMEAARRLARDPYVSRVYVSQAITMLVLPAPAGTES